MQDNYGFHFLPNVQEHATPLAVASVETAVEVQVTGDVADSAASGGCGVSPCSESSSPGVSRVLERGKIYRRARVRHVELVGGGENFKRLYGSSTLPQLNTLCCYRDDLREALAGGDVQYAVKAGKVLEGISHGLLPLLDMAVCAIQAVGSESRNRSSQTESGDSLPLEGYFASLATRSPDDLP